MGQAQCGGGHRDVARRLVQLNCKLLSRSQGADAAVVGTAYLSECSGRSIVLILSQCLVLCFILFCFVFRTSPGILAEQQNLCALLAQHACVESQQLLSAPAAALQRPKLC